ncbi:galactoside-binding lectin [Dictyocaulus viviparus]|uniref:Galectin n=1 Tax=Dictyocaulus viviparus TaxID=29172 RepID=A0A0D8XZJ2_DICVI|nr:galactoside-binding lectin [Dictyocaulus viviparus]
MVNARVKEIDELIPVVIPLNEPLRPGCIIEIDGRVLYRDHKNLTIELLSGPHVVLHVNFRFHNERVIVMNSANYGSWGTEIRHDNPLHQGDNFNLQIQAHPNHYDIELNGRHIAYYPHRYPMEAVQALGLEGDFKIEKVHFSGFCFDVDWNSECDYGHSGYGGYGTDRYIPPSFGANHAYNAYF